ncbi:MAG TPA: C40 family peptidase [Clostridiales bacterium]|nr:C40 family peptidase [Clostridiales bacterium]
MRGSKAIKTVVYIASAVACIMIPTSKAHAEETAYAEQGVAGIAAILQNASIEELESAYSASIEILSQKIESPYANLGVSIADNYVNVRKEPSTESEVVGKLYRGCAADILDTLEGGWVKIKSGDVEGYIAMDFLAIGDDAESMVDKYATKWATVNTQTLRVREKPSTESSILTLIPIGEKYIVINEEDEWVEILLGTDEDTGSDFTGFVKKVVDGKELINISVDFKYAISVEEENRILKLQAEAEAAEAQRKLELAQEEAERKEAERKAAERKAQKAAEEAARETNNNSSSSSDSSSSSSSDSSSSSSSDDSSSSGSSSESRSKVVKYALKFVGNRYVYGGTSLTKGTDCSGFVQSVYRDFGYSIPRDSRSQAASAGKKVSESDILPGDLVFYANSSGTVNHVAMYIGNGMIVHAANSRQGIITSQYKYRNIYCVRRVIN